MNARKTILSSAMALAMGSISLSANALTTSATLVFDSGVGKCILGGTYPDACTYGLTGVASGSMFAMDTDGNGITAGEWVPITNTGDGNSTPKGFGIHLGSTYASTGSHSGPIDGSENPAFDIWEFFGGTGMHQITSPITVVDDAYGGDPLVKVLDISGWNVTWNGIPSIPMGGDAVNFGTTGLPGELNSGLALMTCSTASCSDSSTFTLDFLSQVPKGDASGFGGVTYAYSAVGQVSAVPVPAAAWLFGSGLVGLVGVARRKKA